MRSFSELIVVDRSSSQCWALLVSSVGRTSRRSLFLPPELRTMLWNVVLSSRRYWVFWASVALSNCGSLMLSMSSVRGSSLKVVAICCQVELNRAMMLSWSVDMYLIHCHESWWTLIST